MAVNTGAKKVALAIVAAAFPVLLLSAQEFEVASVKQVVNPKEQDRADRSKTDISFVGKSGNPFKISGNRVGIQGTALQFIAAAYDVKNYQIGGLPPWADSLIYTIAAKAEGESVPALDMVRPMMQALLADRFQLKLHRETRAMNVYHLVVSAKNPGLKSAAADESFSWNLTPAPNGMLRSKATKESIGDFVQLVGVSEDRPVIDKTGFTGYIDYDIVINTPEAKSQDEVSRAIVDAVKDQLGLKLEPAKDNVEVLVVDRIGKPSEN